MTRTARFLLGGGSLGAAMVWADGLPSVAAGLLVVAIGLLSAAGGTLLGAATAGLGAVVVLAAAPLSLAHTLDALLLGAVGLAVAHGTARTAALRVAVDRAALTDPLTGLANRRGLALAASRLEGPAALAVLDLDGLKRLNDTRGHAAGDRAITALADTLRAGRASDVAARLGGDEMALLCPGASVDEAERRLARARLVFRASVRELGPLDVSFGVAPLETPDGLAAALEDADRAMYVAKCARRAEARGAPARRPRRHVRWASMLPVAALTVLALAPVGARAQTEEGAAGLSSPVAPESPVRFELLGGATAPLDIGFRGRLVFFDQLVLGLSLGVGVYGDLAREIASIGGAGGAGAQIAHDLVSGLVTGELSVGLRPVRGAGFEIAVGYALLDHTLDLDTMTLASAYGVQIPTTDVATHLTLHAIHAELGWTIVLLDHLVVRPAIGWLHVLAADVSLSASGADASTQAMLDEAAAEADSVLSTWGMTPTLSLSVGYRF